MAGSVQRWWIVRQGRNLSWDVSLGGLPRHTLKAWVRRSRYQQDDKEQNTGNTWLKDLKDKEVTKGVAKITGSFERHLTKHLGKLELSATSSRKSLSYTRLSAWQDLKSLLTEVLLMKTTPPPDYKQCNLLCFHLKG